MLSPSPRAAKSPASQIRLDAFVTPISTLDGSPIAPPYCHRPTPCDSSGGPISGWCGACFGRQIDAFDAALAARRVRLGRADLAGAVVPAYEPTGEDWAAIRDPRDHDGFLGEEERAMEALTVPDSSWAAKHLDPGPAAGEFADLWA